MSAFKEQLATDIKSTFLNDLEFADQHLIDGTPMRVLIDDNEAQEREKQSGGNTHTDGIYTTRRLLYVASEDYGAKPRPGKRLILDGKRTFIIVDFTDEVGVYAMTIEAIRT